MAERRHLAGGAALSVFAQVAPLLSGTILSVVLARTLGPTGNGEYALLATTLGIATLVASVGLNSGLTYEVSRGGWSLRRAMHTSYRLGLGLGVLAIGLAAGFYALARHSVFDGIGTGVLVLALVSAPFLIQYQFASALALGVESFGVYSVLEVVHSLSIVLIGVGLAIPFGLEGAIAGLTAAGLLSAAVGRVLLARQSRRAQAVPASRAEDEALGRATRYGVLSWLANLLQQVNYRFDLFILGGFATTRDVGLYSVAVTIAGIGWVLPQALQTVLFPRAAGLDAAARSGEITHEESDDTVARACRHVVLLLPAIAVGLAVLLFVVVPLLYGSRFDQTRWLGMVLLPGVLSLSVGKVLATVIAGRGKPVYNLYVGLITAPLTLGLYFALIPPLHDWGAALATTLSYMLSTMIIAMFFRRLTGITLVRALVPGRADLRDYGIALRALRARVSLQPGT
jgi:O-antigen/teichoic acid export membrane protein